MAILVMAGEKRTQPPAELASPALVTAKDRIWNAAAGTLRD